MAFIVDLAASAANKKHSHVPQAANSILEEFRF